MSTYALVGPINPNLDHLKSLLVAGKVDRIVAVDGGYQHLVDAGIDCRMAIGDFDSLGYVPEGIQLIELPTHKDQTDTEVALDYVQSCQAERVYVYGTLGGRVDHTLAFLQLLGEYGARGLRLTAIGDDQAIVPLWGDGISFFDAPAGAMGTFSLLALSDVVEGVCEVDVEYELENAYLYNASPLGISNEFIGKPAHISIMRGSALLFIPLDVLPA